MSRWVLVDDTDTGIAYSGSWFQDKGTHDSLGNFGSPYLSTLHGTNSSASFSYSFNGTSVIITGTNQFTNSSGVTNPSCQCTIDGVQVPYNTPTTPDNQLLFCDASSLTDGPHVITVNVAVSNQRTFWFDYLHYLPSASVSLDHATLFINPGDSQFEYGTSWSRSYAGNVTADSGSTFIFEFNGISVTWLGFYSSDFPFAATTATYTVDNQDPISFGLNGSSSQGPGEQYNQIFFQTAQFSAGKHALVVIYQGNSNCTPLTLTALIVQNEASTSSVSGTSTILSSHTPSSSSAPVSSTVLGSGSGSSVSTATSVLQGGHHSNGTGIMAGGIIAGLALVCLIFIGCLLIRRRKEHDNKRWTGPIELGGHHDHDSMPSISRTNQHIPLSATSNVNLLTGAGALTGHGHPSGPLSSNVFFTSRKRLATTPSVSYTSGQSLNLPVSPTSVTNISAQSLNTSQTLYSATSSTSVSRKSAGGRPVRVAPRRSDLVSPTTTRDEDSGIRLHGDMVGLLPPEYTPE